MISVVALAVVILCSGSATVAVSQEAGSGQPTEPIVPPQGESEAAGGAQIEENIGQVIQGIIQEFQPATDSLDSATDLLDQAVKAGDFEAALAQVDVLTGKVNALADRVRPGNATAARIDEVLKMADDVTEQLRSDNTLAPEFKASRIEALAELKSRLAEGGAELAGFYPQLTALAEELNRKRRAVSYDLIISAITQAVEQLEDANEGIRSLIDRLREYLSTIKEPLTN